MEVGLCTIRKLAVFIRFRVFVFDKFEFSMINGISGSTNCRNLILWLWVQNNNIRLSFFLLLLYCSRWWPHKMHWILMWVKLIFFLFNYFLYLILFVILYYILLFCLCFLLTPCPFPIFFLVFHIRVQQDSRTSRVVSV
jgi:hypothetical protein